MPRAVIGSAEEIPEGLREEYEEREGLFYLKVDGLGADAEHTHPAVASLKSALGDEREARSKLSREVRDLKELSEKFKDVDLNAYSEMQRREQEQKDKKLIDAGKVDELVD